MLRILFFLSIAFLSSKAQAQLTNTTASPKIAALNNYVFFANECTHGMLIVHGLLYKFNQDLNEQIDRDNYQVNNYSNKDLPEDIFADTWFYDIAPYDWYERCVTESRLLPDTKGNRLNVLAGRMKTTISEINKVRFTLEKLVKADLSVEANALLVYDELQRATDLFERFYEEQKVLTQMIHSTYRDIAHQAKIENKAMSELFKKNYRSAADIMRTLFKRSNKHIEAKIEALHAAQSEMQSSSLEQLGVTNSTKNTGMHFSNLQKKMAEFTGSVNEYFNNPQVPQEYKDYGPYYYYYNKALITKFNRFGNGLVFEMNSILDDTKSNQLRYMELPHFYQVRYPRKLKPVDYITTDPIDAIPTEMKSRKVVAKHEKITTREKQLELKLYDHFIEDGDVISINFNGKWVLEDHPLKSEPYILKINLNTEGKNFIVLHAVNEGSRPPVMMTVAYESIGRERKVIMHADKMESEVLEFVFY